MKEEEELMRIRKMVIDALEHLSLEDLWEDDDDDEV